MGVFDRLRHREEDDERDDGGASHRAVDPDAVVKEYRNALRSASPAVIVTAHAEALTDTDPAQLAELRRRLDARLSRPQAPGNASPEAVAWDLGQLASQGSGVAFALVSGEEESGDNPAGRSIDVAALASGFVTSRIWRLASGQKVPHGPRDRERGDADALAMVELHKLRNTIGVGSSFGGP